MSYIDVTYPAYLENIKKGLAMNLSEALEHVKNGKIIHRAEYNIFLKMINDKVEACQTKLTEINFTPSKLLEKSWQVDSVDGKFDISEIELYLKKGWIVRHVDWINDWRDAQLVFDAQTMTYFYCKEIEIIEYKLTSADILAKDWITQ